MGLEKRWQSNSEWGHFFSLEGEVVFGNINIELVTGSQGQDNEQFPHQVSRTSRSHLMEEHQKEGDGPQGAALATRLVNTRPRLSPQCRHIMGSIFGNKTLPMGPHPNFTLTRRKKKPKQSPLQAQRCNHQPQTRSLAVGEVGACSTPSLMLDPHQLPAEAVPDCISKLLRRGSSGGRSLPAAQAAPSTHQPPAQSPSLAGGSLRNPLHPELIKSKQTPAAPVTPGCRNLLCQCQYLRRSAHTRPAQFRQSRCQHPTCGRDVPRHLPAVPVGPKMPGMARQAGRVLQGG